MDIIYSKCYNGVIMVGGFADVLFVVLEDTKKGRHLLSRKWLG
jgi:hypothetical protein